MSTGKGCIDNLTNAYPFEGAMTPFDTTGLKPKGLHQIDKVSKGNVIRVPSKTC